MGVYTPASLLGCSAYPQSITDFSTFTYDATRNKIFMFGGGHSATPRTDVDTFNLAAATLSWKSDYISTQFSDMQASNYDVDRG